MIRVFPRQTNASPDDDMAFFGGPPLWHIDDEVKVSCTFTYDKPRGERLAEQWAKQGYDVQVGGAAYGSRGGDFVPGRFVKRGYVMTSRGCDNKCWFCYVWKREGNIRELPVTEGYNVLDSNLLQCSERHIRAVFSMLGRQKERPLFTGGLEAARLKDWHVDLLAKTKTGRVFLAYDTPDDYEPLVEAAKAIRQVLPQRQAMCYVLIGYFKDTKEAAERRLNQVLDLGLTPMAMLYRDDRGAYRLRVAQIPTTVGTACDNL